MGENSRLIVNGAERYTSGDKPLLRYLRDGPHLHSVKDGCSEGVYDTYTIVVDGKAAKSCVLTIRWAVGRSIITTEGLDDAGKGAFVYTSGAVGSVRCGSYTPGMVVAGEALVNRVLNSTEEGIKVVLEENICCCAEYRKIIEDIRLTVTTLRGDTRIEESLKKEDEYSVGKRAFCLGVREKMLGRDEYPDDVEIEGMVYASAAHFQCPRAWVPNIDYGKTAAPPGVLAVLIAKDVSNSKMGHPQQD